MSKDIVLTAAQQSCVNYPDDKNLLVRGIAGSGKSLVILKKAVKMAKKSIENKTDKRIAVFTYVNTLVSYTGEILNENVEIASKIKVSTLDKELMQLYKIVTGKYVDWRRTTTNRDCEKECDSILAKVVSSNKSDNRFLKTENREFLKDEIAWMKQRMLKTEEEYLECERVGRGISIKPTKKDRSLIFGIYQAYFNALASNGILDTNVAFETLYDRRDEIPERFKYHYVLIDESQDLSLSKLLLAKELCIDAMVLAADYAQKIYKTGFSWKELGIDIKGANSKKLKGTFRNTYEILALANSLMPHNNTLKNNKDELVEVEMPNIHGEKPRIFYTKTLTEDRDIAIKLANEIRKAQPDKTIAIITYLKKDIDWIASGLEHKGIPYQKVAKGNDFKVLEPGIKLVNYYSSKGLEFDTVILALVDEKKFPYIPFNLGEDELPDHLDRLRNLFYVGITRAKENLFITACNSTKSRLLNDLDPDLYVVN